MFRMTHLPFVFMKFSEMKELLSGQALRKKVLLNPGQQRAVEDSLQGRVVDSSSKQLRVEENNGERRKSGGNRAESKLSHLYLIGLSKSLF